MRPVEWKILTDRLGNDKRSPTHKDISKVLSDLYDNIHDVEHNSVILRIGLENDEMIMIEYFSNSTMIYSRYKDQDFNALILKKCIKKLGLIEPERRLCLLNEGRIDEIENMHWNLS